MFKKLIAQEVLSREESQQLMHAVASGDLSEAEQASVLTIYKLRGISVPELLGFRDAVLELAVVPDVSVNGLMDVCGTGGDGKDTFNISTLTALTLSALGVPVAKHGNNSFSSQCGSSNILQELGIKLVNDSKILDKCLRECQICFLHAPLFHPSLKNVAAVRRQLGVRTIFNLLGPLVNPLQPEFQLAGVATIPTLNTYQQIFAEINNKYAIVHSYDGYDEISLTGKFIAVGNVFSLEVFPEELGLQQVSPNDLSGGSSIPNSLKVFKSIIKGDGSIQQKSVISANVATAFKLKNPNLSWRFAYQKSFELLGTTQLEKLVYNLVRITNEN